MLIQLVESDGQATSELSICDCAWSDEREEVDVDLDDGRRNVWLTLTVEEVARLVPELVAFLADKAQRKAAKS